MKMAPPNSPNSPEQPGNTAGTSVIPTRTRAIDATTIAEIARLTARQLTESESCRRLGIKPKNWFDWKSRHNRTEKFAALLEAFRADRIDSLIGKIEAGADGVGMKQPDWRAAAFLLTVTDKKRFGPSAETQAPPAPAASEAVLNALLAMSQKVFPHLNQPPQLPRTITDAPPKALIDISSTVEPT
jgi:hypothetical protein